jgi:hypothetical protein
LETLRKPLDGIGMDEGGRGITGWLAGESRMPGQIEAGLVRDRYCVSTISLAEDWWMGGIGTGGQGSDVTPRLVPLLRIEHVSPTKVRSLEYTCVWRGSG